MDKLGNPLMKRQLFLICASVCAHGHVRGHLCQLRDWGLGGCILMLPSICAGIRVAQGYTAQMVG